jgi:integrase/recombinase XerD
MTDLIPRHLTWLRAGGRSDHMIHDRGRLLRHANSHLPHGLDEAHTEEIQAYQANQRWSDWTRYTYDGHLRGYYAWGVNAGHYTLDPTAAVPRPREGDRLPDPITDGELADLFARAPAHWHLVFALCAYAGLRVSEAARLDRRDITPDRIRVRLGKGRKDAYVDTHPVVWAMVRDLPAGPVVRDGHGQPVTGYQLTNRSWHLFHRTLGMPEVHLHRLRHWYATALLGAGADLETVRQCMRHARITSTVGYTLIASQKRRTAILTLPVVGAAPAED